VSELPCVEIEPRTQAAAAVIWLHGLGADGHDFEPIVPALQLPAAAGVRFVFPHAPQRPVTIAGGMRLRAWYDITDASIDRRVDEAQLEASAGEVGRLIDREVARGIPSTRIVVAGFSQGGAVALHAALSHPQALAGVLGLSTYFATARSLKPHPANAMLPALICHGTRDPIVPEALGHAAQQILQAMGHPVRYATWPIAHEVCAEEVALIGQWLREVLAC
jgi:phospholipase/carboxylesterase